MKKSKISAKEDPIELADKIKGNLTKKFLKDIENFKRVNKMKTKKTISKKEAITIADKIKSGMSIRVMKDLEELKNARSKALTAKRF